jgi:DMSO/TMAO reductase YedYZ molybdopterin-dependent catalytic subunit
MSESGAGHEPSAICVSSLGSVPDGCLAWLPGQAPRRRRPGAGATGPYVTDDFPVLSAGPTPHTPLAEWDFTIRGAVDAPVSWTWEEFRALRSETVTIDVHCVTKWSKLDDPREEARWPRSRHQ